MAEQHTKTSIPAQVISTFRDYVGSLPHQWVLDNLIPGSSDAARRIVSSAMVKEAVAAFAAKNSLSKRFKELPPALKFRCAQVYLMGAGGLTLPDQSAYRREPILPSLLVFAAAQGGPGAGAAKLFGFGEFEPTLRPLMAETLLGFGDAGEHPPSASANANPRRPLSDVAVVCSLAAQGQLTRSVHGGLSRSALNALKRLVHDPTLTGRGVPGGVPGHPAGFLVGYCLKETLIIDDAAEYAINRQAFSAWIKKSVKERQQSLNEYIVEFLEGTGLELALELLKRADGRWIAVNQILPETDRQAFVRALGVFEFLGRVQTGHSHGSLKFTPCNVADYRADGPVRDTVIMPDFSVLIPQEVLPEELFEFSVIGILYAFDKVYNGQITKESVSNALSSGVDAELLRGWLRKRNAAVNVVKTVDEWIREFNRLYVSRGFVLASCDDTVTRQIAALEPLRKHLTEVKAHTVFMINHGSEQEVLDMLGRLGFDTRMPGEQRAVTVDKNCRDTDPADDDTDTPVEEWDRDEEAAWQDEETDDTQDRPAAGGVRRFSPLTDFGIAPESSRQKTAMNRTKYGSGLKALEPSEMIHVVDYAMLTNQALVIDYNGSAYIKPNIYTVVPLGLDKGIDAAVEAEIPYVRGRKQFYLDKIKRIAVVAQ